MKSRNFTLCGVLLLFFFAFTVNSAIAADWPITGTVVRVGMSGAGAQITIKDVNGNYWTGAPASGEENEQLATALTAAAGTLQVVGTWDTDNSEWKNMMIAIE